MWGGILLQLERLLDLKNQTLNRKFVLLLSLLAIVALWSALWEVRMVTSARPAASRIFLNEQPHTRLRPEVEMDHRGCEDTRYGDEASVSHVME